MLSYPRLFSSNIMIALVTCLLTFPVHVCSQQTTRIKYEFFSDVSNYSSTVQDAQINGIVSSRGSQAVVRQARAFLFVDADGNYDACQQPVDVSSCFNAVAIIHRGGNCTFSVKTTRAKQCGAAAVIIYDPQSNNQAMLNMFQNNTGILSVYMQRVLGSRLFDLAKDRRTLLNITLEPIETDDDDDSNRPSHWYGTRSITIFIAVSIAILVCLCVSWFAVYYCQRYRSRTTKDRLQARLNNAAKKALTKISLVTVTETSPTQEPCVVCLDMVKTGDVVRQLVCGHTFHQTCVDPWLLSHRHCPLCNLDILAAYRIPVPTRNRRSSVAPEPSRPSFPGSLATLTARSIADPNLSSREQQQQLQGTSIPMQVQPVPSISAAVSESSIHVRPAFERETSLVDPVDYPH